METTLEKFMGIDLHTNRFNYFLIDERGNTESKGFEINDHSIEQFFNHIDKNTYVMIESSTNSFKFYDLIKDHVKGAILANPRQLNLISFTDKKTDRIDAEKLARYLKMQLKAGEQLTEPVYVPEQRIRDLRSLLTSHRLLNRQITQVKNRIHALLKQNLIPTKRNFLSSKRCIAEIFLLPLDQPIRFQIQLLLDQLNHLEDVKQKIEVQTKISGSQYFKQIDILTSITGVSVFMAIALISDIADICRFANAKKLTSYLRSAPRVDSSNETVKIKGISKCGRKQSIMLLAQSCHHFSRANPRLNRLYNKYHGKKKASTVRMAILRNVIVEIFHMLNKNEYHWYRNEKTHLYKKNEYIRFLKSHDIFI